MTPATVTRFAPSPTGLLHLGHAFAALTAWSRARQAGGRFLLRLEDIDGTRCRPAFGTAIFEDLAWLGVDWDGPVRVQSEHFAEYEAVLATLRDRGLIYPCFCTRAAILREIGDAATAPHDPDGAPVYPGTCRGLPWDDQERNLAEHAAHAWRLDTAAAIAAVGVPLSYEEVGEGRVKCDPARFGDIVLARKETPASYHLCVTHDDAAQGVTIVTRGRDLKPATDVHRLLQALMGWAEPAYAHHPVVTGSDGRRLAKREAALTLRALRDAGRTATEVRVMAGLVGNQFYTGDCDGKDSAAARC